MKLPLLLLAIIFTSLTSLNCAALPSEYSITGYNANDLSSENTILEIFHQWRDHHKKVYQHAEEMAERLKVFKNNLKYIVERNSNRSSPTGHTVGLNRFADLTNEEFRQKYISKVKMPDAKKAEMMVRRNQRRFIRSQRKSVKSCDAPSSLDWRTEGVVTGVKDQGDCGSCWSFSSTGAMEGINAISTGKLVSLSEQELVDCDSTNYGCEGGNMDYAFEWVVSNGGIDSEADYPYTGVDGSCNTRKEKKDVVSIDGYEDVEESDSALLCATVNQPISVGIDGGTMDFQLYTGGIYDGDCSSNPNDIDHAVLVVGYGSKGNVDYWIVKNSWGTSWGIEGYIYIKRNTNLAYGVCAINAMASYPTKSSDLGIAAKMKKWAEDKLPWTKPYTSGKASY